VRHAVFVDHLTGSVDCRSFVVKRGLGYPRPWASRPAFFGTTETSHANCLWGLGYATPLNQGICVPYSSIIYALKVLRLLTAEPASLFGFGSTSVEPAFCLVPDIFLPAFLVA
jgi:hypothetical protein